MENNEGSNKPLRFDLKTLPTRQYLDLTVNPILLQALKDLAKVRPTDPIQYLAAFLLKNKAKSEETLPPDNGTDGAL